jgi:hypothetical protein
VQGVALNPGLDHFLASDAEAELHHLIDPDPALLHQPPPDRRHHEAEGDLGFGPPVTTRDGQLETSLLAQGGLVRIGDPHQDRFERPTAVPATHLNADRAEEKVCRRLAFEVVHVSPPRRAARIGFPGAETHLRRVHLPTMAK